MTTARDALQQLQQLDNEAAAIADFQDILVNGTIFGFVINHSVGSANVPTAVIDAVWPALVTTTADLVAAQRAKVTELEARITVAE